MSKLKRIFLDLTIFILAAIIFSYLEFGYPLKSIDMIIRPIIFAFSLLITLKAQFRGYLLLGSLILLFLMIIFTLIWQLTLADWIGSLGFGMLVIYVAGFIPQLIKKGYIERL